MKGVWGIALASTALALAVLAPPATAADGDQPPRIRLETGGKESRDYALRGEWYSRADCPILIVDPAPGLPEPVVVSRGVRRIRIVYRTALMPAFVAVEVYGSGVQRHQRSERLFARREGGEVVAWIVSFRAPVRGTLRVFPFAGWEDHRGCGPEFVEAAFRLRSR